jgi:hypothetical protein
MRLALQELIEQTGHAEDGHHNVGKPEVWVRNRETGEAIAVSHDYLPKLDHGGYGSYVGKAGSMRRSRKGTPRRLPNGRRKYEMLHEEWMVVAYKPNPVVSD